MAIEGFAGHGFRKRWLKDRNDFKLILIRKCFNWSGTILWMF
jgi:hypothetical protein